MTLVQVSTVGYSEDWEEGLSAPVLLIHLAIAKASLDLRHSRDRIPHVTLSCRLRMYYMSALSDLLDDYRNKSQTEREKGTYFEELIRTYFRFEATYKDLYSDVWLYSDWAKEQGLDQRDTGIDLVAKTHATNEFHAIQCKCFAEDYKVQKKDIDSFFTASGKKPFSHRIIVTTTNLWSEHADDSLRDQQLSVNKIDLHDLENSQIDWAKYKSDNKPILKKKKTLRRHQETALSNVVSGLNKADRGKLIMACGTGKTFTSLKIAEQMAGKGKRVLFLVPSLSLLSQTLTEWTQQSETPMHNFAVCSDSAVGKKRKKDDDIVQTFMHELRYPATTDPKRLAGEMKKRHDDQHMSVVYSTYHSIEVINQAQKNHALDDFDLIICDEAHRTTGATFEDESESNFVKIHDSGFIKSKKRLYMTATPRIYGDSAKATAEKDNVAICSMDDEKLYGKELHVITFSESVKLGLLTDYKVIVLSIDEEHVSSRIQNLLKDDNNQLKVDDAAKIIGCWKALSKQGMEEDLILDPKPMKRSVAFCQVIDPKSGRSHKVSSKQISSMFQEVVEAYQEQEEEHNTLICEARHIDGSMNASEKTEKIDWLKSEPAEDTSHILSNVRCLSEGVDIPALDAVLFLTPRNSQIDVVQSVGRVMRNADGKNKGYVILPVVIPMGMTPSEALNDNKVYKVVWEVLQALRSHDDRFDAMINKLDLIGKDTSKMEVIAITDKVQRKAKKKKKQAGKGSSTIGSPDLNNIPTQMDIQFEVGEVERALYAKVVKKCGNRNHWEDWAKDIAKIAKTHIARITTIIRDKSNKIERKSFFAFAEELRDDLNDSITDDEVIEMLSQHLITKPVFDALFKDYSFANNNPVSQAMQQVLDTLQEHRLDKETDTLDRFYSSVQLRAEGIDSAEGKQRIILELYDKFFRNAFPRMTERLGIVYTPVEVVDFIIHSVNDLLKSQFKQTLNNQGVHIIDPFTGTGTFVTRLLQSGLIKQENLKEKYMKEIHANEIVLLAYYIAAINIESVYYSIVGGEHKTFNNICLTDTFQLHEKDDTISGLLEDNSDRRIKQKKLDIRVIMGNPPYSAIQSSENDNNKKTGYPNLDGRIRDTFALGSSGVLKNALYDSYVRAMRWAIDRIGNKGIIGFVTGSAWIDRTFADVMRKCLAEECTSIYIVDLRGDIRKNMLSKGAAKQGGNIFGSSSMTGIAVTFFVKNPSSSKKSKIYYLDIGEDLSSEDKLNELLRLKSCNNISELGLWSELIPDKYNDWINQRDDKFESYPVIGSKKKDSGVTIFNVYSGGVKTNRDAWCYNFSRESVAHNMSNMADFYNSEMMRYKKHCERTPKDRRTPVDEFIDNNPKNISWTRELKRDLLNGKDRPYNESAIRMAHYRPFIKCWMYFDRYYNNCIYQMPKLFPNPDSANKIICVSGIGSRSGFSALMVDAVPCLDMIEKGQCFPIIQYKESEESTQTTFINQENSTEIPAITSEGLEYFRRNLTEIEVDESDVFYYVYGLLHSRDYVKKFGKNLIKELPRIPCPKESDDFKTYSVNGKKLSELHLNYESVECYPAKIETSVDRLRPDHYLVDKMKFKTKKDKTIIVYNEFITINGIPEKAYDYLVSGKPAITWVMERQSKSVDKKSGIVNDANNWATDTIGNHKYPLELLLRVVTVSLQTLNIIDDLPSIEFID